MTAGDQQGLFSEQPALPPIAPAIGIRPVAIGSVSSQTGLTIVRRALKFLHTIGAIGFMGAMASQLVILTLMAPPTALASYAALSGAVAAIARWVFLPSLGLTLVAGLFAMALNNGYQNAGWAWLKLATGILIFEGFFHAQGSMEDEAARSASALAGQIDPTTLGGALGAERATLWVVLAVAMANVALGVWRPRLSRRPR